MRSVRGLVGGEGEGSVGCEEDPRMNRLRVRLRRVGMCILGSSVFVISEGLKCGDGENVRYGLCACFCEVVVVV